jgi:hypothetical protein
MMAAASSAQPIELRALVTAFGSADSVILVGVDDFASHPARDGAQLALLVGRCLILSADAKINGCFAHARHPPILDAFL